MPRRRLRGQLFSATAPVFYDTIQEWPIGGELGRLRRNEMPHVGRAGPPQPKGFRWKSLYSFWRAHALEGRLASSETEGIWPINDFRVQRHDGNPPKSVHPSKEAVTEWSEAIVRDALTYRIHHYYRMTGSREIASLLPYTPGGSKSIQVAIGTTEQWFDPPGGVVIPNQDSEVLGTHAVPLLYFDAKARFFAFPNSWGEGWGDEGWGYLHSSVLDHYLVESWAPTPGGIFPKLETKVGLTRLLWSCSRSFDQKVPIPDQTVYGREIIDVESDERLAWAFARKRGPYLDIDEFFVWPTHRGKGLAHLLADMLHELSKQTKRPLRLWVSHSDAEDRNAGNLAAALRTLGLHLHSSPVRWSAYVAVPTPPSRPRSEYVAPARAATFRERLRPKVKEGDGISCDVYFGTNRVPVEVEGELRTFGATRDTQVHVGICSVDIPKWHQFGEIRSHWLRRLTGYRDGTLRMSSLGRLKPSRFWSALQGRLKDAGPSEVPDSLLFIHGYNVSFNEAAVRAAQIGFDLNIPGITAFFSWPSAGELLGYPADEETIGASEPHLLRFMLDLVDACRPGRLHVVAHSMGNRGFLRCLQRVIGDTEHRAGFQLGQIILAAPDVDTHLFRDLASCYVELSDRTTLYASPWDRALSLSSILHRFDRAGLTPPVTVVNGIDTVVVPGFNLMDLGHGYYADAASVLYDMHLAMMYGASPEKRPRLGKLQTPTLGDYWELRI